MRKVYVVISYWPSDEPIIEAVFTSRKKAESFVERYYQGIKCLIKTEVLI